MVGEGVSASQVIFVDTPGVFAPHCRLDRAMVSAAWQGAADADLVAVLVDSVKALHHTDADTLRIIKGLKKEGRPAVLLLNKIDIVRRDSLLALSQRLNDESSFLDTFMVSGLTGSGTRDFLDYCSIRLPHSLHLFPKDQLSNMPDQLLAAEITREKLYLNLHQELPYALTVETDAWEERRDGSLKIEQTIFVQRDGQKGIVLGKGGQVIKRVSAVARRELQTLFDRRVHLFLFVKVRDKWQDDPARYRYWGLDFSA